MKIALDAMGGDFAPKETVEGAVLAARQGLAVLLVGDESQINSELAKHQTGGLPITVKHAPETVAMDESPSVAIRRKNTSIMLSFEAVKAGEADAVVSAGNSGAAMAAGMITLRRIKGVDRPAIAVCVPTVKEPVLVLDAGGNVDCKPIHLVQFAIMGEVYAKYALDRPTPRMALLSNASEEAKGNELTRITNDLLKDSTIDGYNGYVEGKDIYRGDIDVVITDGFVGNVVLKLSEGLAEAYGAMIKRELSSTFLSKIGALLTRGAFGNLKRKMDYAEYGGAPLLGIGGNCIISHGGSKSKAIKNALFRAAEMVKHKVDSHLAEEIESHADIEKLAKEQSVQSEES